MTVQIVSVSDLTATISQLHASIGSALEDGPVTPVSSRKADQDQWLAEAVVALGEAERLIGLLELSHPRHDLTLAALQGEIMDLRHEIERMQRIRSSDRWRNLHPEWMRLSPWSPVR